MSEFDNERASILADGQEDRVDVNTRHLIDKILARYATENAVYRELLQNSNDAKASRAEIRFETAADTSRPTTPAASGTPRATVVERVVYRNNGLIFTAADWKRLTCIASGNPDPEKIGFFGVGSFTLFQICEEPMVVSGETALVFKWKGDALWTKLAKRKQTDEWTSFVMPVRDPTPLPSMTELGSFLATSLTFTSHLHTAVVFVDGVQALQIKKDTVTPPQVMELPRTSSWWGLSRGPTLTSPRKLFTLSAQDGSLTDTEIRLTAARGASATHTASVTARVVATDVTTSVAGDVRKRMFRVTKKEPVKRFPLRVVVANGDPEDGAGAGHGASSTSIEAKEAKAMLADFVPRVGAGKVFIGFKTSQTTGFACHLAAPFIPTVEREAIDLVESTLRLWNYDLLFISGVVMRLALEHGMSRLGTSWDSERDLRATAEHARQRRIADQVKRLNGERSVGSERENDSQDKGSKATADSSRGLSLSSSSKPSRGLFSGLVGLMGQAASEVKRFTSNLTTLGRDEIEGLLESDDPEPLSPTERSALVLMRSFEPQSATPQASVGTYIAKGFTECLPTLAPPVLTQTGVVRGTDAHVPNMGIDRYAHTGMVRAAVLRNAESYVLDVAGASPATIQDLCVDLAKREVSEDEAIQILCWCTQIVRRAEVAEQHLAALKRNLSVKWIPKEEGWESRLHRYEYIWDRSLVPAQVPLPPSTLPTRFSERIPDRVRRDPSFRSLFRPLSGEDWAEFIIADGALEAPPSAAADALRARILSALAGLVSGSAYSPNREELLARLRRGLGPKKCLPTADGSLEAPTELYLQNADLGVFSGAGIVKVSASLMTLENVSEEFLIGIGVREAVSLDILFTHLDKLKWNQDPTGLVMYLSKVEGKMTDAEWNRLRRTQFLPSSTDENLHAPPELCLPLPDLRALPFVPVVRWPGSFREDTPEGYVLKSKLQVQSKPSLKMILSAAAKQETTPELRQRCLFYLAERLVGSRADGYDAEFRRDRSALRIKFLPTHRMDPVQPEDDVVDVLSSPLECFSDQNYLPLGFHVVTRQYQVIAARFGVRNTPDMEETVQVFLAIARRVRTNDSIESEKKLKTMKTLFNVMAIPGAGMGPADKAKIRSEAIIPVEDKDSANILWKTPDHVYFQSANSANLASSLFHVVPENAFLRNVGVKDEPNVLDMCREVLNRPEDVFAKLDGPKKYLELLQLIAHQRQSIPQLIIANLKKSKFLLATKLRSSEDNGDSSQATSSTTRQPEDESARPEPETERVLHVTYALARPADIVIVDNTLLQRMFNPLSAPLDSGLEPFYEQLGASYISKQVSRTIEIDRSHPPLDNVECLDLRSRILQRRALLLEASAKPVAKGSRRLLSDTLRVAQVNSIREVSTLRGVSRAQPTSCCARTIADTPWLSPHFSKAPKPDLVLLVTRDWDAFDVAAALGRRLYSRCTLQDTFLLAQILETSLAQLRARGFAVDKLVHVAPAPEQKAPTPAPPNKDNPSAARERTLAGSSEPQEGRPTSPTSPPASRVGSSTSSQLEGFAEILTTCYEDADPNWVKNRLKEDPTENGLRRLKQEMEKGEYPRRRGSSTANEQRAAPSSSGEERVNPVARRKPSRPGLGQALKAIRSVGGSLPQASQKARAESQRRLTGGIGASDGGGGSSSASEQSLGTGSRDPRRGTAGGGVFGAPSDPAHDMQNRNSKLHSLERAIQSCKPVDSRGISSAEAIRPPAAEVPTASACEVIPGHLLRPVTNSRGKSSTENGILVFWSAMGDGTSALEYCQRNFDGIERFSVVLGHLAAVFGLRLRSIAIYYAPEGRTIAFNSNRALHFNLRFFLTMHDTTNQSPSAAYIYWFTVFCHELAHNFAASHDLVHGHYMEAYIDAYMSKLFSKLRQLGYA